MRGTLIPLLLSAAALAAAVEDVPDPCAGVSCDSGLVCAMQLPPSCRVSPCPSMPGCVPKNLTCQANSCAKGETCELRQVTCIAAPCYPIRECKKYPKCAANEEYNECSLSGPCEPTCTDSYPICTDVSCGKGACECKPGYFRHNGKCIIKAQCPDPTCDNPNEVWNKCPSSCTKTCRILRGKEKEEPICPAVCGSPQCTCAPGYVRDDDWNCVKEADCPTEFKCDSPHEQFVECASHCEPTCENRSPTCIESCAPAKCQCKPGYVRHNGHCLYAVQCPLEGNSTTPRSVKHRRDNNKSNEDSEDNGSVSEEQMHIMPFPQTRPAAGSHLVRPDLNGTKLTIPLIRPAGRPDSNDIAQLKPQISPAFHGTSRPNPLVMPLVDPVPGTNGTKQINPLIRPFIPDATGPMTLPFEANETIHIMPLIDPIPNRNGTVHTLPYIPNTKDIKQTRPMILPFFPDANETETNPITQNSFAEMIKNVIPFREYLTSNPFIRPFVEPYNETMSILPFIPNTKDIKPPRPMTRPFLPDSNETMHIMPLIDPIPNRNGTIHSLPFIPNTKDIKQTRPMILPFIPESNETMHILPLIPQIDPIPDWNMPLIDPIPDRNGTVHVMPFPAINRTNPLIRPYFPDENGTMHIMPLMPQIDPIRDMNGTLHILPYPGFNGTVIPANDSDIDVCHSHKCPKGSRCDVAQVRCLVAPCNPVPICVKDTKPDDVCATHKCPKGSKCITAQARCLVAPCHPVPICVNETKPDPISNMNGTAQIMPLIDPIPDRNGTVHILPYPVFNGTAIPANDSDVDVCHSHKCPKGSRCDVAQVRCLVAPCNPVPICVKDTNPVDVCATHKCPKGKRCDVAEVRCIVAPCHPVPICVNETKPADVCATHKCPKNSKCEVTQVQCFAPPCDPVPTCVSNSKDVDVCSTHKCPKGLTCEATEVACFAAPCMPVPTCVRPKPTGVARESPINCGKNEQISERAPPLALQETCRGVSESPLMIAAVCNTGCVCQDKFKRDANGVCVPNNKCWKTAGCQENEIWLKCRSCEPTCDDAKEVCTAECSSGCACDEGYVRGPGGQCIEQSDCPKLNHNSTRV